MNLPKDIEIARRHRKEGRERQRNRLQRFTCIEVIVAAARRGWSSELIGLAAGVSHQAVRQRLDRYEAQHGKITSERRKTKRCAHNPKHAILCATCGKPIWSGRTRQEFVYCSGVCQEEAVRQITDDMIETTILLRWSDESWKLVSQQIGFPMQSIQIRIWKYLFDNNMLDSKTVESIWCRGGWHREGYKWLERNTGLIPTENGTLQTTKRNGYSPWCSWPKRRKGSIAE